jgi:UDP-N-acetylglucosamine--N-acetylmuramyl-(pentapeptide) pyrophosphoryl-undecaprenol N-acetylglucosamine transferase
VFAGLAVAEALRDRGHGELVFVGTPAGLESELVPPSGLPLALVPGSALVGAGAAHAPRALFDLARGSLAAARLFAASDVGLVVSFGGYAAAGAVLAAAALRIPVAMHEANLESGVAHRLLRPLARRVYVGLSEAEHALAGRNARLTGNPIRAALAAGVLERGEADLELDAPRRVLVTGGSLGSPFLDAHAPELLAAVAARGVPLRVLHQSGRGDAGAVRERYARARLEAEVRPFVADMSAAMREAHFAVSCAGALTLAELCGVGLPALIVPLASAAGDHQTGNARALCDAIGAWWMSEADFDPAALAPRLAALLRSPQAWAAESKRMASRACPSAAAAIADDCLRLLEGG